MERFIPKGARLAIFSFLFFGVFRSLAFCAGVAAIKEQRFHADNLAKPLVFLDLTEVGSPSLKFNTGKSFISVEKSKIAGLVVLPKTIPVDVTKEEDIAEIRKSLEEMKTFTARFPKCHPPLKEHLSAYQTFVENFDKGLVRHEGKWITNQQFEPHRHQLEAKKAVAAREELERLVNIEQRNKERREFQATQRRKGLEEYQGKWLPIDEVKRLVRRDRIITESIETVNAKTIDSAIYSIFQVTNEGFLVRIIGGTTNQGGINTSIAYVFGGVKGLAAEGDHYENHLYWCGNHSYTTTTGHVKTVNAYCLKKSDAISRVRGKFNTDSAPEDDPIISRETVQSEPSPTDTLGETPPILSGAISTGSGFFVGSDGYFVTNAHVISNKKSVEILHDTRILKADLVKLSKAADLALLKVQGKFIGLSIVEEDAAAGTDVLALGFPQPTIQGIGIKVTKGIISSDKGLEEDETRFQIDAAVQPGNSGGPLCDTSGRLVGVIVAGLNQIAVANVTGVIPQNVNYAIKASEVKALLSSKGVDFTCAEDGEIPENKDTVTRATSSTGLVIVK